MLIATIAAILLFLSGGGGGQYLAAMEKYIPKFVEDEARAARATGLVEQMADEKAEFIRRIIRARSRLFDLDVRHNASRYEYRQVFLDMDKEWDAFETRFLDLQYELRGELEREEWNAIFEKVADKMHWD